MTALPRTSFVIPARNAASTLAQTLDSVLAQTQADWEALVIDDGSTDETPQLLGAYAQRDARVLALRSGGGAGASAARNLGLAQARGQRVVFLDSDDWIAPVFLERLHAALDAAPGAAAAYCDRQRVMPDGALAPVHSDPRVAQAPLDAFARACTVAIHAVLVERAQVLGAGGFEPALRTCEDWDLWQRIARLGSPWVHVAEPLAFYRTSAGSLSQDMDQLLIDASVVVHRGFGADPRLPAADAALHAGVSRAHGMTPEIALAYLALWCSAVDAARGREHARATALLAALPAQPDHAPHIATALLDGVMVGLLAVPQRLAARWAEFGPRLHTLIDALGATWHDATAARRVQYAFERLLLQHDNLAAPRALSLTLGLRVDLRALTAVTPPEGVDRFYVYLCDGANILAVAEPGTLGTWAPRQWIELAARHIGWRSVVKLTRRSVARSVTPQRLAAAAQSVRGALRRSTWREQGWRAVADAASRDALIAAAAGPPPQGSHSQALAVLREQAVRAEPAPLADADRNPPDLAATDAPAAADSRAYWEHVFRTPDPWHDGSAYEQEKHGLQLELLPEGPIERALELACAEGHFTEKLAARVQRLIATDIADGALARAAARCRGQDHIEFRQLDLASGELPQDLDLITCSEVLYHMTDEAALRHAAERMAAALKPGGHIVTAHVFVLKDDMTRTGFDWDQPWGAATISRVFADVPALTLERSLCTELYRIDRFVRREAAAPARTETRPIAAAIEHEVARHIVWGGASARRADLANTERHQRIPVLAYRRIADDGPQALARWRVDVGAFGAQMGWLRRNGYHAIGGDELAWFLEHQHPFVGRPVMITFDDGYQDFADAAWPLLRRHDLRAEVFVVTDLVGGRAEWDGDAGEPARLMDAPTIAALARQGAHFGSHLASHRGADGLQTRELAEELLRSQHCIAQWTGLAPCSMAAPFGLTDQRLQGLAAECGYRLGFSTESAAATLSDPPMHLPRIEVGGDMTLQAFASAMEACR